MLSQLILIFNVAFFNMVFGSISFVRDFRIPVDQCYNMSAFASTNKEYSFIYRCSEDSVWKFTYTDCMDCNCSYQSATLMGGCTSGSAMYRVFNCSEAQKNASNDNCGYVATGSSYSSSDAVSIGACVDYHSGGYYSYRYECVNDSLYYHQFSQYDCKGVDTTSLKTGYNYMCGNNCTSAHVIEYDNGETCNYAESEYRSANPNENCNYLIMGDGTAPIAVGVCLSYRQAYYEYSRKYVCSNDKTKVNLIQWMDSSSCDDGQSESYVIAEYSADEYTINCDSSTCNGKYRTYTSCSYQYQFTETPIVWNYCQKTYLNESKNTFNYSFNDYLYQMVSCIDGVMADFYFTDSSCKYFDTFTLRNTSSAGCEYELTGCVNSNDIFSGSSSISLNVFYALMLAIWLFISF